MKQSPNLVAKTLISFETFHSESERNNRIKELKRIDKDIKIKSKVAYDVQDYYMLEYTKTTYNKG